MPLAAALVLAQIAFVFGAAWDIQWHYAIGRDRPFIPPHLLLLGGIAATGVLALGGVLWSSLRRPAADGSGRLTLFKKFRAPVGLYLAGFGALCSALAFPWDDYWHRLYGLDVTIWAPFHVMIIAGMALAALGAAYLFAVSADRGPAAAVGTVFALASGAAILLLLQAQALDREGILSVRPRAAVIFPPLLAGLTIPWLVAAALVVRPARWFPIGGATLVALALTAIRAGMFSFVPWALRWAAALDGSRVREQNMALIATPLAFPAWIVAAGLVVDAAVWLSRSGRIRLTSPLVLALAGLVAGIALASLDRPWERTLPLVRGGTALNVREAFWNSLPVVGAIGAVAGLYGAAIGGALAVAPGRWTVRRRRGAVSVLCALAVGLAASAAWSGFLAAQGLIGPVHPPLLTFLPARPVTSSLAGWVIGLVPAWAFLAFVVAETAAGRGPGLALGTGRPDNPVASVAAGSPRRLATSS